MGQFSVKKSGSTGSVLGENQHADHREIFESDVPRRQMVEMLELFVDQGWPAARRLLYELPELFR